MKIQNLKIKLIYIDENESPEIEYFLDENLNVNYNSNLEKDIIKEKYNINFIPNILYYKEGEVKDSDLIQHHYPLKILNFLMHYSKL
ncbi:hypothetical protein [Brachyspira hampsonii]|uniref:hypothetical protein n=1 Tax=Brachyspira hampsonii TaxID=1287055 RepID=UPI000347C69E|nr:hypothetical protein [Brachyspira hampsonii]